MKRHPALRELSSDHHQGLVQARRLVQAADAAEQPETSTGPDPEVAADLAPKATAFIAFWHEHTIRHFREEEEVLLPAYARYGDPGAEPVVRVLVEHIRIRRLVADLQRQVEQDVPSLATMRSIGEMLRAHIRFEEDVLFPLIELAMPEEALAELPGRMAAYASPSAPD